MKNHHKPSMLVAVLSTITAVCNLSALLLTITAKNINLIPLLLFLASTILMGIAAIGNWRLYAKKFIKYEVTQHLEIKED